MRNSKGCKKTKGMPRKGGRFNGLVDSKKAGNRAADGAVQGMENSRGGELEDQGTEKLGQYTKRQCMTFSLFQDENGRAVGTLHVRSESGARRVRLWMSRERSGGGPGQSLKESPSASPCVHLGGQSLQVSTYCDQYYRC